MTCKNCECGSCRMEPRELILADPTTCPVCKSSDGVVGGEVVFSERQMTTTMTCSRCDAGWAAGFTITALVLMRPGDVEGKPWGLD